MHRAFQAIAPNDRFSFTGFLRHAMPPGITFSPHLNPDCAGRLMSLLRDIYAAGCGMPYVKQQHQPIKQQFNNVKQNTYPQAKNDQHDVSRVDRPAGTQCVAGDP